MLITNKIKLWKGGFNCAKRIRINENIEEQRVRTINYANFNKYNEMSLKFG